jgi:pyruvate/2-oxoglutarate dehydrogenase complex dihydrolipoamide acyltransferase (E2) component
VGDLVFECEVDKLTTELECAPSTMLIESHESGFVAKLLVEEGSAVPVDVCVAVLAEERSSIPAFAGFEPSANGGAGEGRMFCWQAYLKTGGS